MGVGVTHSQQRAAEGSPVRTHQDAWDDAWEKQWLRAHAFDNPIICEHAYGAGLITFRAWYDYTEPYERARVDALLVASVASTLTIDEALEVIRNREPA